MPAPPPNDLTGVVKDLSYRVRGLERRWRADPATGGGSFPDDEFDAIVDHDATTDASLRLYATFQEAFDDLEPHEGALRLFLRTYTQLTFVAETATIPAAITNLYVRGRAELCGDGSPNQMFVASFVSHSALTDLYLESCAVDDLQLSGDLSGCTITLDKVACSTYYTAAATAQAAEEYWIESRILSVIETTDFRNLRVARDCRRLGWSAGTHPLGISVHKATVITGNLWTAGDTVILAWEYDGTTRAGGTLEIGDNLADTTSYMKVTFADGINRLSMIGNLGFQEIWVDGSVYDDPGGAGPDLLGMANISNNGRLYQVIVNNGGGLGVEITFADNDLFGLGISLQGTYVDVTGNTMYGGLTTPSSFLTVEGKNGLVTFTGNIVKGFGDTANPGGAVNLVRIGSTTAANRDGAVISGNCLIQVDQALVAAGGVIQANFVAIAQLASVDRLYAASNLILAGTQATNAGAGVQTLVNDYVNVAW